MVTRSISIEIPESLLIAEKTDEVSFAKELCILVAVKLYEMGQLSSGRAAELVGMLRIEFLISVGHYKVFPFMDELNDIEGYAH
jgi:predicted HTH domain antitoxin